MPTGIIAAVPRRAVLPWVFTRLIVSLIRGEIVSSEPTNLDGMLQSYLEYLNHGHFANAKRFDLLRLSDKEAAIAEAVVFGILQGFNVNPQINDAPNTGGPDLICCAYRGPLIPRLDEDRFVVEATSLDPDAVSGRSHIPNEVPEDISGGAFGLVTPLRANIDETVLLVVITEQGENRNQCEEQRNLFGFLHGFARRGT